MSGTAGDDNVPVVGRSRRQRLRDFWRKVVIRATLLDLAGARLLRYKPAIVDDLITLGRWRGSLENEAAEHAFLEARDLAIKLDYDEGIARAALGLAGVARARDDVVGAADILEREIERLRSLPDKAFLISGLNNLGEALLHSGRITAASDRFREAEQVSTVVGDWHQETRAQSGLAFVDYNNGDFKDAFERWSGALSVYERHRNHAEMAHLQHWLAAAAMSLRRFADAHELAAASAGNYARAGLEDLAAQARDDLSEIDEFIQANGGGISNHEA